jgi:hypothetical protein
MNEQDEDNGEVSFEIKSASLSIYDARKIMVEEFSAGEEQIRPMPGAVGEGVIAKLAGRRSPAVATLWANINLGQILVVFELDAEGAETLAEALRDAVESAKGMDDKPEKEADPHSER